VDAGRSVFWDDLARDLKDPQFLREYVAQSIRIATIDRIVNELDEAREAAGLSKAELARAINSEPATVRRLFSAGHVNPTLGTLAGVAAALGMRVVLEPLDRAASREEHREPSSLGPAPGGDAPRAGRGVSYGLISGVIRPASAGSGAGTPHRGPGRAGSRRQTVPSGMACPVRR